jgi:hypothetical protein
MKKLLVGLCILLALPAIGTSASAPVYWQMVFSYSQNTLSLPTVTRIPPMTKIPMTPGVEGAPVRVAYRLDWLDASGATLSTAPLEMPLGYRTAPAEGGPCQVVMPEQGIIVVRVTGPDGAALPAAIRMTQESITRRSAPSLPIPGVFDQSTLQIPIGQIALAAPKVAAGPIGSTKIRNTGPDANRMVVVVMGDGYTATDLAGGSFTNSAANLVTAFLGKSPWNIGFNVANVYRIDVQSNESGSDNDPYGTYKDTYFNSSFWVSDIARLLALDGTGYSRAVAAADAYVGAGVWDAIFILVNSVTYGGSGGAIAVSSVHPSASQVILHEYGHTYAGLADEYSDAYPGYPPGDPEPNVDFDYSGSGLKWLIWVESGTPLPTPQTSTYAHVVGTFEGARYLATGIYRPYLNCLMRSLGVPFCPICQEANMISLFGEVSLADSTIPTAGTTVLVGNSPKSIGVAPIPVSGLTYEWKLNGIVIPWATGPTCDLVADSIYARLSGPSGTLLVKVSYPTALIRQTTIKQTFTWGVKADCNGNQIADDVDLAQGVLHDDNSDGYPDECAATLCCVGMTGNVDCDALDAVDIADITRMIDYMYITFSPLCCEAEANIDHAGSVDISDLTLLIDYLYISFTPLPNCR